MLTICRNIVFRFLILLALISRAKVGAADLSTTYRISILDGDSIRTAAEARDDIRQSFQEAAESILIRTTNCFWAGTRRADGSIRLTLVSTEYLDPVDAEAELITRENMTSLRDVLADESLPFDANRAKLIVPAGAFRIVDVRFAQGE